MKSVTLKSQRAFAVAVFWAGNEVPQLNAVARAVSQARKLSMHDNARLFALLHTAAADALIVSFRVKYQENAWRPITAIRAGYGGVAPDPNRESLLITPPHPEYPCAHCIVASAVSTVLQAAVGNEVDIMLNSPTAPGVTRRWTRLQHYSDEVSNARIHAGFHYRFSADVAKELGRKIGELAASSRLQPVAAAQASR